MDYNFEKEVLTIRMPGRVDGKNAPAVQEEILTLCKEHPFRELVIDCDDLVYISSAGLRVLLSLKKTQMLLTEVSQDVYDIFETTGFSSILNIRKKMKSVSVEGCEVVGFGATCKVYRVDDETVYKVYNDVTDAEKVERERNISRKAFLMGIPTAISYDIVKVGDTYATVFEMLKAHSYRELLVNEPERMDEYLDTYTDVLKKIHETEVNDPDFPSCKEEMMGRCERLRSLLTEEEFETLMEKFRQIPESDHMIHGDYHIGNIMYKDGEIMLIDLESLSKGIPAFDIAAMYVAFRGFPEAEPGNLEQFFGISDEMGKRFYEGFLDRYFAGRPEEERRETLHCADLLACTRILTMVQGFKDKTRKDRITEVFLPRLKEHLQESGK